MKNISLLQKHRANYRPNLPPALQGAVKVHKGAPTESVGDQAEIKKLFPNTYGLPQLTFERAEGETPAGRPLNVGVILFFLFHIAVIVMDLFNLSLPWLSQAG